MVLATLTEKGMSLSNELLEEIVQKVRWLLVTEYIHSVSEPFSTQLILFYCRHLEMLILTWMVELAKMNGKLLQFSTQRF